MIQIQDLSLHRGAQALLEQTTLTLHAGWKVGIVGANGVGKSSLFKLLLGELQADAGELKLPSNLRIAHMAQEVGHTDRTALDYVIDGDHQLRSVQAQLADAEARHEAERIGELHAALDALDGYSAEARAQQLLAGLGFVPGDAERPVSSFSGGWRIRLNLAKALMCPSDLLLLDEPTNHLDLDATIWLEQWLRQYPGTLLLISHDRDFLDNVAAYIVHQAHRSLTLYKGNYTAFERLRAEKLSQQQAAFEKQQARVEQIEQFVRRFRAKATKAKQAQSRLKELERMEQIAPAHVDSPFSFRFDTSEKLSSPLLSLNEADLGYPERTILKQQALTLLPGTRIGLLGANGAGKSTLIKTLVGDLPLLTGQRQEGEHLRIGYFAQHQLEALDMKASPFTHLQRISPDATDQELRNFLGSFGFNGDDALDPVGRFSGGEKARVALALIAWQKPNLLLLDEPTNHLDLEVRHALTLALQGFEGALILVSHDRHLLRNTVDQFLLVHDGQIEEFKGDLEDYHRWLAQQRRDDQAREKPVVRDDAARSLSAAERKEQKRQQAEQRARLRPLRQAVEKLEKQMEKLQSQQSEIETALADTELYDDSRKDELKQWLQRQAEVSRDLDAVEADWLEQQEALETLEQSLEAG
ncbi:ATP-binding cassette domain-containing protein [Marinobacterium sp. AK62]|uniref:ATP-binding cassette domain-containing protein n=1 Tax=Marinobacterium alkalitolerans TaxID=1542925 RepID=A0ABS3ZD41_9GAMM|nr:ATP-binding cassette domain-containing protein [Marinobacterium alkalitolerans]MBP0049626.1 ATP-binding cassette domain-containing protein [Marinobacterium alkalitolerans]